MDQKQNCCQLITRITRLVTLLTKTFFWISCINPPFLLPIASRKWIGCKIVNNLQHAIKPTVTMVISFPWLVDQGWPLRSIGHPNILEYNMDPPFAGLLHQANGSRARLLPTYSTQPNTMVIYDGYLTSSSSLSVPYLGVKTSMNSHSIFFDAIISWDIPLFDLMSLTKRILWEYFSQLTRWTT